MSDQDTYAPGPAPSPLDRQSPLVERVQREAKLVYDEANIPEVYADIFSNDDRIPIKQAQPEKRE